jgi:hypothetical protein
LPGALLCCVLWTSARAESPVAKSLLAVEGRATFVLQLGRIVLEPRRYDRGTWSQTPADDQEEFLCITANRGVPSLHFQRQCGAERLVIDVLDASTVKIQYQPSEGSAIWLDQPVQGPIRVWLDGEEAQSHHAASLWHLAVAQPSWFAQHLDPVLRELLGNQGLVPQLHEIAAARSFAGLEPRPTGNHDGMGRVHELVNQLTESNRVTRATAERELIAIGPALLRHLDQLPASEPPDPEQQMRLRRIRRMLTPRQGDTPHSVAQWLAVDQSWKASLAAAIAPASALTTVRR